MKDAEYLYKIVVVLGIAQAYRQPVYRKGSVQERLRVYRVVNALLQRLNDAMSYQRMLLRLLFHYIEHV